MACLTRKCFKFASEKARHRAAMHAAKRSHALGRWLPLAILTREDGSICGRIHGAFLCYANVSVHKDRHVLAPPSGPVFVGTKIRNGQFQ